MSIRLRKSSLAVGRTRRWLGNIATCLHAHVSTNLRVYYCGQVFVLPTQRQVRLAVDDNFVIRLKVPSFTSLYTQYKTSIL